MIECEFGSLRLRSKSSDDRKRKRRERETDTERKRDTNIANRHWHGYLSHTSQSFDIIS